MTPAVARATVLDHIAHHQGGPLIVDAADTLAHIVALLLGAAITDGHVVHILAHPAMADGHVGLLADLDTDSPLLPRGATTDAGPDLQSTLLDSARKVALLYL